MKLSLLNDAGGGAQVFSAWLVLLVCAAGFVALTPLEGPSVAAAAGAVVAGGAWLVAVRAAGGVSFRAVLIGTVVLRLVTLAADPRLSDDIHRYVWEGTLVQEGVSPYAWAPESEELRELRERLPETYAGLNHRDVSAAYPPVTQAVVAALSSFAVFGEAAARLAMRVFFALCDVLALFPLAALLRRRGLPEGRALVFGFCPLVGIEFAGSGHFDSLGIGLLLAGLNAVEAGRSRRALTALVAAVLVKWLPLVALPFALRDGARGRRAWRGALAAGLGLVAGFVPFLFLRGGSEGLFRGLANYGLRWEWTNVAYRWIEGALALALPYPEVAGRAVVLSLFGLLAVALWRRGVRATAATGALIAAFVVLTPTLHPWYVAWAVPFLALRPLAGGLWFTACVPLAYASILRWRTGVEPVEPAWLWPLLVLPSLALFVWELRRVRSRP